MQNANSERIQKDRLVKNHSGQAQLRRIWNKVNTLPTKFLKLYKSVEASRPETVLGDQRWEFGLFL